MYISPSYVLMTTFHGVRKDSYKSRWHPPSQYCGNRPHSESGNGAECSIDHAYDKHNVTGSCKPLTKILRFPVVIVR